MHGAVREVPGVASVLAAPGSSAPGAGGSVLGSPTLVLTDETRHRTRFLLDRKIIGAGRHPDSAILLDDITVSRYHAQFRWLEDEFWVIDVGSLNGTYVNGVRVQSLPLNNGDEIQIGRFHLTFVSG
ncbi:FHA domain-containing protein [Mycobacterium sp. CBMA293]|nr:FHA domain-containing protein [Mycolicibacterium sp. CBMA 360]MUL58493.1 FHA domain-containing protein [Mycolicibacterium sp. CBMA 335]MUL73951.1 FHA domain-containing protein [Mycolicibacterium sp. CBMA 311]MUL93376.1 FHA domain-containing protein [Mycolicibacterium sp. CBMA 230]MUM04591.1 hypothetical protein [Mycolicibacterium sp. CBMA 213]MUM10219.1 FHA domain-containing protein [Mycolicibacterium sp. CBMA 293]MUM34941.1 FHA domain-containing protein [Mycolicibacterium sp. CBMA 361]